MLTYFQALVLGALQGITELFPISSLGHSVILPRLFGWELDQGSDAFLVFLVATHAATALVLFAFYVDDWRKIALGAIRIATGRTALSNDAYARLGALLVLGTIPAGLLGLLFESHLKHLFATPMYASLFLFGNGFMLYAAESLRKNEKEGEADDREIARLSFGKSLKIGFAQAIALLPGFSRTGATLGGALMVGLDHANAARFSFLLATPIIFLAAAHKLPLLFEAKWQGIVGPVALGALAAAMFAYLSVRFLTNYFRTKSLLPFAFYCIIVGGACLMSFLFY